MQIVISNAECKAVSELAAQAYEGGNELTITTNFTESDPRISYKWSMAIAITNSGITQLQDPQ